MKSKKPKQEQKNGQPIKPWYVNPEPSDDIIAYFLKDPIIKQKFITTSLQDGVPPQQLKEQLQYFDVYN